MPACSVCGIQLGLTENGVCFPCQARLPLSRLAVPRSSFPRSRRTTPGVPEVEEIVVDATFEGEVPRQIVPVHEQDPGQGMRILYPAGSIPKGEAWNHLWHNPPTFTFKGRTYMPLFERVGNGPDGTPRTKNPYRKDHDAMHWAWTVKKWVEGTPKKQGKPQPPREKKTRYDLLMDESWLPEALQSEEASGVCVPEGNKVAAAKKIFEGLKILLKYKPDAEVDAQHDVLMAGGPEPSKLDQAELKELDELGWSYDIREESWRAFT